MKNYEIDRNMKFKKIIVSILIMLIAISINTESSAKYVFECTKKAAEITIINV